MPFRRAWIGVAALLGAALYVFWPGFLAELPKHGFGHHLHGATAFAWMLLLIMQGVLVDRRDFAWHRRLGRIALVLIPLVTAGNFMVVHALAASQSRFAQTFGDGLVFVDTMAAFAFAAFCWAALAHRRDPRLHGGFLLATAALLVMAVVTRVDAFFADDGPLDGWTFREQFTFTFDLSMVLVLLFAAAMGWRHRRRAQPFVALGAVALVQWLGFHFAASVPAWRSVADAIGAAPPVAVGLFGLLLGTAATWAGWRVRSNARPLRAAESTPS